MKALAKTRVLHIGRWVSAVLVVGGLFATPAQAQESQPQPPAPTAEPHSHAASPANDWDRRAVLLSEQPNLFGAIGGLRVSTAGPFAPGQLRASLLFDWFKATGFLCNPESTTPAGAPITCSRSNKSDDASRVGGTFALNVTPLSLLELFATVRLEETSNSEGQPQSLHVLGNSVFGLKSLFPRFGKFFTFGVEHQLLLLNGAEHIGSGVGVSARIRVLFTADLRKQDNSGFPFRFDLNVGTRLDGSSAMVAPIEQARGAAEGVDRQPISRIERFAQGVNRTNFTEIGVGVTFPTTVVQPYAEYSVEIPDESSGYQCRTSQVSRGDVCLGLADFSAATPETAGGPGYSAFPSRLSLGVRASPLKGALRGLSAHAAIDIGLSGTRVFVEEVAPTAPWTLYLGLAYALDTKKKPTP